MPQHDGEHPKRASGPKTRVYDVRIPPLGLAGTVRMPPITRAMIVFAHGSGSSRLSPRNTWLAETLNEHGLATLLFDLLGEDEADDRAKVFDIPLLASRLVNAVRWLQRQTEFGVPPLGLFGASTGAAAAIVAAAQFGNEVGAVVSRGGRPDLAADALDSVQAPTLLIVGGADFGVIELNEQAYARLTCPKSLEIVPGATHLFPEPGAMEAVMKLTAQWFTRHLAGGSLATPSHRGR